MASAKSAQVFKGVAMVKGATRTVLVLQSVQPQLTALPLEKLVLVEFANSAVLQVIALILMSVTIIYAFNVLD